MDSKTPFSLPEQVAKRLREAPGAPGVYWMEGRAGRVLYVGKALNIRERLQSHFQTSRSRGQKVHRNLRRVRDLRWMPTATEREALVLEESLIREHNPPLNVVLPHYRFLCITASEEFPRFQVTQQMDVGDGNLYFGPYPDRSTMERLYQAVTPVFRVRGDRYGCDWDGERPRSPCHLPQLGRCSAPCGGEISKAEYRASTDRLAGFLLGADGSVPTDPLLQAAEERHDIIKAEVQALREEKTRLLLAMQDAVGSLRFEDAALLRDQRAAVDRKILGANARLKKIGKQQAALASLHEAREVVQPGLPDLDAWCVKLEGDTCTLVALPFRQGRLVAGLQMSGSRKTVSAALRRHYSRPSALPRMILLVDSAEAPAFLLSAMPAAIRPDICIAGDEPAWNAVSELARRSLRLLAPGGERCRNSKQRAE